MSDTGTKPAGESICGTCGEEMEWCEYDDGTNGQFICWDCDSEEGWRDAGYPCLNCEYLLPTGRLIGEDGEPFGERVCITCDGGEPRMPEVEDFPMCAHGHVRGWGCEVCEKM